MPKPVEFWFEFASTYTYPAAMQVEDRCRAAGVPLIWRSFLLGPVFAAQGMRDSPFNIYPVKGTYMWRDLERVCAEAGLGWQKPSAFPRGSLLAARITSAHSDAPWIGEVIRAIYHANFAEDRNISDDAVIAQILSDCGKDAEAVIAAATTPEAKDALKAQTQAAQDKGIFGAPSFTVGDELFWGHDRMDAAIGWALRG